MSTEKLDHYKRLYEEYVLHLVELNNHHNLFLKNLAMEPGKAVRHHLRKIAKIQRALWLASMEANKEQLQNDKEAKIKNKQARLQAEAERKLTVKKGRPPKPRISGEGKS